MKLSTALATIVCFVLVFSIFGGFGFAKDSESQPKMTGPTEIVIGRVTIDTAVGEPDMPDEYHIEAFSTPDGVYLAQFNQFTEPWMLDALESAGVYDYQHINRNTYRIEMDVSAEEEIRNLDFVQWLGIYQPYYKISEEVWNAIGSVTIELELTESGEVGHIIHVARSYGGVAFSSCKALARQSEATSPCWLSSTPRP